jgi:hypothetical protein
MGVTFDVALLHKRMTEPSDLDQKVQDIKIRGMVPEINSDNAFHTFFTLEFYKRCELVLGGTIAPTLTVHGMQQLHAEELAKAEAAEKMRKKQGNKNNPPVLEPQVIIQTPKAATPQVLLSSLERDIDVMNFALEPVKRARKVGRPRKRPSSLEYLVPSTSSQGALPLDLSVLKINNDSKALVQHSPKISESA